MGDKVFDVVMIYIYNTEGRSYTVECFTNRQQTHKFHFQDVEHIELDAHVTLELKQSMLQLAEGSPKIWNMRFAFPMNMVLRHSGRLTLEFF
jgi:hypothetical protein